MVVVRNVLDLASKLSSRRIRIRLSYLERLTKFNARSRGHRARISLVHMKSVDRGPWVRTRRHPTILAYSASWDPAFPITGQGRLLSPRYDGG